MNLGGRGTWLASAIVSAAVLAASCSSESFSEQATVVTAVPEPTVAPVDVATPAPENPPEPNLATVELSDRIVRYVATLEFDEFDEATTDACPFPDANAVIERIFGGVAPAAELPSASALETGAFRLPLSGVTLIACNAVVAEGDLSSGVGIDISIAPSDFDAYQREFNDPNNVGDVTISVTRTANHLGGFFDQVDVRFDGDDYGSREVSWRDAEVLVTAYAFGPIVENIDLDLVQAQLVNELPNIINGALPGQ